MKNYVIAKKNLNMNNNWFYGLSVEGRKAFDEGNKEVKTQILLQLLQNNNITMNKIIQVMS